MYIKLIFNHNSLVFEKDMIKRLEGGHSQLWATSPLPDQRLSPPALVIVAQHTSPRTQGVAQVTPMSTRAHWLRCPPPGLLATQGPAAVPAASMCSSAGSVPSGPLLLILSSPVPEHAALRCLEFTTPGMVVEKRGPLLAPIWEERQWRL